MDGMTINSGHERFVQSINHLFVNPCRNETQGHEIIPGVGLNQDASLEISATDFLDNVIPLLGTSYADVESLGVDIPMRYARFYARLRDGSKVRLRNSRAFAGWSCENGKGSYLFFDSGLHVEIRVDPDHPASRRAPASICAVIPQSTRNTDSQAQFQEAKSARKFVAVDGSQILLFDHA